MILSAATAVPYIVTAVSADRGYKLSLSQRLGLCDAASEDITYLRTLPPPNVAISDDGTKIAFVERLAAPQCGEDRIILMKSGKRITIPRPESVERSVGGHSFWVSRLRVVNSGTLFATLDDRFFGAYIGVRRKTFIWRRDAWRELLSNTAFPNNTGLGDVRTENLYAVTIDWDNAHPSNGTIAEDRSWGTPTVKVVQDGRVSLLGAGTLTALCDTQAAGYTDGFQHSSQPTAVYWKDGKARKLSSGVAFGTDCTGYAVGDDRKQWTAPGHPTLWHGTTATRLTLGEGSAFAIRDNVIVGTDTGKGFILRRTQTHQPVQYLDRLGRGRWNMITAFAIATSGRILALGEAKGKLTIFALDARPVSDVKRAGLVMSRNAKGGSPALQPQ